METLRKRVPFKAIRDDDEDEDNRVLDEQEQEEVINDLRAQTAAANAQFRLLLQILFGLSAGVQLVYLFSTSKASPLFALFPRNQHQRPPTPLPLSTPLTILSLGIHAHLFLLVSTASPLKSAWPFPLSHGIPSVLYALAAVAPALSLFLGKQWQVTIWWCTSLGVIWVGQIVMEGLTEGEEGVAEVEARRYRAPGA